jgi:hypothetical protein
MLERKYSLSLARSREGTCTNRPSRSKPFDEDRVDMGIPSREVARRSAGDHGGALDLSAGRCVGESLNHSVDELADLTVQPPVVAERHAQDLGEGEDHLPLQRAQSPRAVAAGWCPTQGQRQLVCHMERDRPNGRAACTPGAVSSACPERRRGSRAP